VGAEGELVVEGWGRKGRQEGDAGIKGQKKVGRGMTVENKREG